MNVSAWKKLEKIDILIKKNALNWFQQMKSHFCDEKQWKIIKKIIIKQEKKTAEAAIQISNTTSLSVISEEILESAFSETLARLTDDENWDVKNWKTISTITALLKFLN